MSWLNFCNWLPALIRFRWWAKLYLEKLTKFFNLKFFIFFNIFFRTSVFSLLYTNYEVRLLCRRHAFVLHPTTLWLTYEYGFLANSIHLLNCQYSEKGYTFKTWCIFQTGLKIIVIRGIAWFSNSLLPFNRSFLIILLFCLDFVYSCYGFWAVHRVRAMARISIGGWARLEAIPKTRFENRFSFRFCR